MTMCVCACEKSARRTDAGLWTQKMADEAKEQKQNTLDVPMSVVRPLATKAVEMILEGKLSTKELEFTFPKYKP